MRNKSNTSTSVYLRRARLAICGAIGAAAMLIPASAQAVDDTTQFAVTAGALAFGTAPDAPNLPALTLNGQAQTLNAQMANFSVSDATGSGAGWNVTVVGDNGSGKSAVFKQYNTTTSTYGSASLAQNSLTLNSSGASFSAQGGTTGTAPTHQCGSGCFVDAAPGSPVKVVSAAANAGMGTYLTSGYSASSLALNAPTTIKALGANEVYRVNVVWSLNSGP
jgi:WxL domain surface cell wall-binding